MAPKRTTPRKPPHKIVKPSKKYDDLRVKTITEKWTEFKKGKKVKKVKAETVRNFLESVKLPDIKRPAEFNTWGGVMRRVIEEEIGDCFF